MLRGHGWMRLSALRSIFIAGSESIFSCVVVGRARARSVATTVPVASLRASAKQFRWACARIWIASSLSLFATTRTPNFTSPRRGRSPGRCRPHGRERGSELKTDSALACPPNRCGKTRAQTGRGNNYARRRLLQCTAGGVYCSARTKKLIRAAVKQIASPICTAWGRCMAWGRRQTQNVHRPRLYVYTRTAVSRMRRSARVQRGRAIICSIAAGANCRSVACARSAH